MDEDFVGSQRFSVCFVWKSCGSLNPIQTCALFSKRISSADVSRHPEEYLLKKSRFFCSFLKVGHVKLPVKVSWGVYIHFVQTSLLKCCYRYTHCSLMSPYSGCYLRFKIPFN